MKSPLWLSRIRHGFILQGTDNNRLYSGNHVTIISKISPHTGDWRARLEKMKSFSSHSKSCLLNPQNLKIPYVIIYLCYILFSHSSMPRNPQRDQKPPNTTEGSCRATCFASARDLHPCLKKQGLSIGTTQWVPNPSVLLTPVGGLVERHPQLQLSLAAAARSTPAWRTHLGSRLSRL